jgi:MFS family permease
MKTLDTARWTVLVLLFVGGMINYLDRSAIGIAAPFLAKQLSLSPSQLGWVFSIFFFGYAAFCFVGGYASDRIGGRNVFAIAAVDGEHAENDARRLAGLIAPIAKAPLHKHPSTAFLGVCCELID